MHNNVSCRRKKPRFSRSLNPFKKQKSHEVKGYGDCCYHVQKKVLLKGFSKIAKSKRCRRTTIKLFVFFLCTSGFFYQTWSFLQMYLAYPTTLDTSEENPDSFMEPALTICNRNRILRQPYCKIYPEECTWEHTTWESFCNANRRMCPPTKSPDFIFGIPVFKFIYQQNNSNAFLNAVGPQEGSTLIGPCERVGYSHSTPCNSTPTAIQVPKTGFPYRCFSLFSLLLKPYEEPSNLTVIDSYSVFLDMNPEEYFNTVDEVQAMVIFHDPRKAVNPMTDGIPLAAGKQHQLFPTMERRESLPSPYASNCMDYLKEWKKNGGSGPLSRFDCIEQCKIEAMVTEHGCVSNAITYPNKFPVCKEPHHYASSEVSRRCANDCKDACEENIYHATSDTILDLQGLYNATDEFSKNQIIAIKVSFNRMKMKILKQIPRTESIELFSYIGGYLGMWLGISLAAVYDLGEIIYDVINSTFLKQKRKQEATTTTEQFGHPVGIKK